MNAWSTRKKQRRSNSSTWEIFGEYWKDYNLARKETPCRHWRRLKNSWFSVEHPISQKQNCISFQITKNAKTLGQRRTWHDGVQIACRLQEQYLQKVEPFYPFIHVCLVYRKDNRWRGVTSWGNWTKYPVFQFFKIFEA